MVGITNNGCIHNLLEKRIISRLNASYLYMTGHPKLDFTVNQMCTSISIDMATKLLLPLAYKLNYGNTGEESNLTNKSNKNANNTNYCINNNAYNQFRDNCWNHMQEWKFQQNDLNSKECRDDRQTVHIPTNFTSSNNNRSGSSLEVSDKLLMEKQLQELIMLYNISVIKLFISESFTTDSLLDE